MMMSPDSFMSSAVATFGLRFRFNKRSEKLDPTSFAQHSSSRSRTEGMRPADPSASFRGFVKKDRRQPRLTPFSFVKASISAYNLPMSEETVLYRKYRPASFKELIGQKHVTEPLEGALKLGSLSHAYLFAGSRGTGKTSVARIFAR